MTQYTIEKYRLYYFGKRSSESEEIAQISFFNNQNIYLGNIRSFKEGQTIPDNKERTHTDPIQV